MAHEILPLSDLAQLQTEVLDLAPEFSLPRNLSDFWLTMLERDLGNVVKPQRSGGQDLSAFAAAPMAIVFNLLWGKSPDPDLTMPYEKLWEYLVELQIEINLEIVNRKTAQEIEPATIENIFSNRRVRVTHKP